MRNKEVAFARYDITATNQLNINANDNTFAANDNDASFAMVKAAA